MKDISIDEFGFSVRTSNCLKRRGYFYLSQIMELDENKLYTINNMGSKSVEEVLTFQKQMRETYGTELDYIEHGIVEKPVVIPDILLIHKAFPELIGNNSFEVIYENEQLHNNSDIAIGTSGMSIRTTNVLQGAGFMTLGSILFERWDRVESLKNFGAKSKDEFIDYIRSHVEIMNNTAQADVVVSIHKYLVEKWNSENAIFEDKIFLKAVRNNIGTYVNELEAEEASIEIVHTDEFINAVLLKDNVVGALANVLFMFITAGDGYISMDNLVEAVPVSFVEIGLFDKAINHLVDKEKIEKIGNDVRQKLPSLDEWLETLKDNYKQAVNMRLNGMTLEECGQQLGVTRERVRQIVVKAIEKKPLLREDDHAYWFKKYDLDAEAMSLIFGDEKRIYNYLNSAYDRGELDVSEMLNDSKLTRDLYDRCQKYLHRNSVLIGREYVPITRDSICRKLAEVYYKDADVSISELYDRYTLFVKENNLDSKANLLFTSERVFEARIVDKNYLVAKQGRKVRFYAVDEVDSVSLVERIGFDQFIDVEISTRKLMKENEELMKEYDIHDEYELHNLLKKTLNVWNADGKYDIEMTRMPYISFGNADRERQTVELLMMLSPINQEGFLNAYEEKYGVPAKLAQVYNLPFVEKYKNHGILSINQPELTSEELDYMARSLNKDFYMVSDVKRIYTEAFGLDNVNRINSYSFNALGFKLYTDYIIRKTTDSIEDCLTKMFTEKDILIIDDSLRKALQLNQVYAVFNKLRYEYELLEFDTKKYMTFEYLKSINPNVTKEQLKAFVEDVLEQVENDEFFTYEQLIKKGFTNKLILQDCENSFYIGLLKYTEKLNDIRLATATIFCKTDRKISTTEFIRSILQEKQQCGITELWSYIREEYGITVEKDKIIQSVKNSDMYFDQENKHIYLSCEQFYSGPVVQESLEDLSAEIEEAMRLEESIEVEETNAVEETIMEVASVKDEESIVTEEPVEVGETIAAEETVVVEETSKKPEMFEPAIVPITSTDADAIGKVIDEDRLRIEHKLRKLREKRQKIVETIDKTFILAFSKKKALKQLLVEVEAQILLLEEMLETK